LRRLSTCTVFDLSQPAIGSWLPSSFMGFPSSGMGFPTYYMGFPSSSYLGFPCSQFFAIQKYPTIQYKYSIVAAQNVKRNLHLLHWITRIYRAQSLDGHPHAISKPSQMRSHQSKGSSGRSETKHKRCQDLHQSTHLKRVQK